MNNDQILDLQCFDVGRGPEIGVGVGKSQREIFLGRPQTHKSKIKVQVCTTLPSYAMLFMPNEFSQQARILIWYILLGLIYALKAHTFFYFT